MTNDEIKLILSENINSLKTHLFGSINSHNCEDIIEAIESWFKDIDLEIFYNIDYDENSLKFLLLFDDKTYKIKISDAIDFECEE